MANQRAWGNMKSGGGGGGSSKFMKLKPDQKNRFRPIGEPVDFWRFYVPMDGKTNSAITDDPNNCVITQKYSNITPKHRAAINVIDRADGKLRILEGPFGLFSDMQVWEDQTGESPSGPKGADFAVKVDIPGNDRTKTKYTVTALGAAPLTPEEKKMIKEEYNGLYDLEKEFEATDDKDIEEKLGLVASKSSGGSTNTVTATETVGSKSGKNSLLDF